MKKRCTGARRGKGGMRGYTLIELMIVVVVVGILAALVYPSYRDSARRGKRAEAKAELLETAQELERCNSRFGTYNNGGCDAAAQVALEFLTDEGNYEITGVITATTFTLDAVPQGGQADDAECGTLRLTQAGVQGSQGTNNDVNDCW